MTDSGQSSPGDSGSQGDVPPPPPPPYGEQPLPPGGGQQPTDRGGAPPPNYLVWAILTTIFCCLPVGIAAIVYAAQVNSKYAAGDISGANEYSRKARQFSTWAAIAGVIVLVIYVIVVAIAASSTEP